MENDIDAGSKPGNITASTSNYVPKSNVKKIGINLLKRSKHDLLRLLSILEGELEARDIYISTLEARLNNQRNAKNQYFVHRLNDPFLSLHRDDYMFNSEDRVKCCDEMAHIEPLPLLDKVVSRFKNQQQKMHHQMALASKIHRKMAHELAEEKRKRSTTAKTEEAMLSIEEERERFNARIMCERERTKRIEMEYRKLLSLCKREGKRHKIIVISLLMEQEKLSQQLNQSRELQINKDATEPELQARLQEALQEKQELSMRVKEEQTKMDELKAEFQELEKKVWKHFDEKAISSNVMRVISNESTKHSKSVTDHTRTALEQASALYSYDDEDSDEDSDDDTFIAAPKLPLKMGRAYSAPDEIMGRPHRTSNPETAAFFSKHHPMSVAQSTRDVTLVPTSSHPPILLADGVGVTTSGYYRVKPGSSIAGLDAMKSSATSKEMLSLDFASDDVFKPAASSVPGNSAFKSIHGGDAVKPPNISPKTVPPKPNRYIPGTVGYVPFRSPHSLFNDKSQTCIASSPLSGAANFAMNSPNSPNIPQSSPFAINRSMAAKATVKPECGKHEQGKKSLTLSARITSQTAQQCQFQTTRMKFQNVPTVTSETDANGAGKENSTTKRNELKSKKSIPVLQKTLQLQSSPRTTGSMALPTVNTAIKTETPLGDGDKIKQPLPPKAKPMNVNANNSNQVRPPPLPPKSPGTSSDTPSKRPAGANHGNKSPEPTFQRKSGSVIKRITPSSKGNEYSTNGSVSRITKGPTPPTLPAKMSSRHPTPPAGPRQSHSSLTRSSSNDQ